MAVGIVTRVVYKAGGNKRLVGSGEKQGKRVYLPSAVAHQPCSCRQVTGSGSKTQRAGGHRDGEMLGAGCGWHRGYDVGGGLSSHRCGAAGRTDLLVAG